MSDVLAALAPWRSVADSADAFFLRAARGFASEMHCRAGCCDCCAADLTVMFVEALAISAGLAKVPQTTRRDLTRRADCTSSCALLVDDRCAVYAFRPLICRTHGLPVRAPSGRSGDDEIGCCSRNFCRASASVPPTFPPPAILDGEHLTAALVVADALARRHLGVPDPLRVSIRDLVRRGARVLPLGRRVSRS